MIISVSGWPGGGSSSLSLLLSYSLSIKHIQGSQAFRYLYKSLSFKDSGADRIDVHNLVEPTYGPVHDKWIDSLLLNTKLHNNILIENDIASFRVGKKQDVCSIFLITDFETRKERMSTDKRNDDGENLKGIDESHAMQYKSLHGIDWFDLENISNTHNLVIDNTNLSIAETLTIIYEWIKSNFKNTPSQIKLLDHCIAESDTYEKLFWTMGKAYIDDLLKKKDLSMSGVEVLKEIRENLPEDVEKLPSNIKDLILNL